MNEPKFTPGPWQVKEYVGASWEKYFEVSTPDGMRIAISPTEEDAHLIVAAPEMYKLLWQVADIMDDSEDCGEIPVDRINAVLLKARGESEVQK